MWAPGRPTKRDGQGHWDNHRRGCHQDPWLRPHPRRLSRSVRRRRFYQQVHPSPSDAETQLGCEQQRQLQNQQESGGRLSAKWWSESIWCSLWALQGLQCPAQQPERGSLRCSFIRSPHISGGPTMLQAQQRPLGMPQRPGSRSSRSTEGDTRQAVTA